MLNKFLKSLSLLLVLNLLIKPFWVLVVDRQVQLAVGDTSYGLFIAIYSFSLWFQVLLDMGIRNYHNTTLAQNHSLLPKAYATYLPAKSVLSLVYALVMVLAAWLTGEYLKHPVLLGCLIANQVFIGFIHFFRASITGLGLYKTDSFVSIADRLITIALVVPVFFGTSFLEWKHINYFVVSHTIAYALTALVCLFILLPKLGKLQWQWNPKVLRKTISQSLPFALFTLLMTIYVRADFVMLERLLPDGAAQAGIYAKGYRLLEAGSMFALLFGNLLLPVYSAIQHQRAELVKIVKAISQIVLIPAVVLVSASYLFRWPIMQAYYPGSGTETSDAFGLLMLNFVSVCLFYIFSTVLTATHKIRLLNILASFGFVLNLGLNFWLIPLYGIYGAIVATLCTQGLVALLQTGEVLRHYQLWPTIKQWAGILAWLVLSIGSYFFIQPLHYGWLIQVIGYMSISFTFALVFGLVDFKQLAQAIKVNRNA